MPDTSAPHLLDRRSEERDAPDLIARLLTQTDVRVVELAGGRVPVRDEGGQAVLVDRPPVPQDDPARAIFLGRDDDGRAHVAVLGPPGLAETPPSADPEARWGSVRDVGAQLAGLDLDRSLTAVALANWHGTHGHCPRCGARTVSARSGWVRVCEADGSEHFPRTDPAVIMAVVDEADRLLLARNPAWPDGRRSVLAGFVEPGETLEAAVAREVAEEVGVPVREVTYVDSQPWPFPASLMLGFTARATSTHLVFQADEIAEAEWYSRAELEAAVADGSLGLPGRLSIARRLVEGWYGSRLVPPAEVPFHREA